MAALKLYEKEDWIAIDRGKHLKNGPQEYTLFDHLIMALASFGNSERTEGYTLD